MSAQYNRNPNDLVYKTLLLSLYYKDRSQNNISMSDVGSMHALDVRALEYAVYRLTYGEEKTCRLKSLDQGGNGGLSS